MNELGATVIGYSLDPKNKNDNFNITNLQNNIIDIRGDIRDFNKLNKVLQIINLKLYSIYAQPLVNYSYEYPRETYEVNVVGTMNVLEAIRLHESAKIGIMVTSDKCYENKEWPWGYREIDPMGTMTYIAQAKDAVNF